MADRLNQCGWYGDTGTVYDFCRILAGEYCDILDDEFGMTSLLPT